MHETAANLILNQPILSECDPSGKGRVASGYKSSMGPKIMIKSYT
jgi:hypothetical protein